MPSAVNQSAAPLPDGAVQLGRMLRHSGAWLLAAALICAPWAKASLPIPALHALQLGAGAAAALWLLGCAIQRHRPPTPALALVCTLGLLALGWWMTLNAHAAYSPELGQIVERQNLKPDAPGAFELTEARLSMLSVTVGLGVLWMVIDLGREPRWQMRWLAAMTLCATSIAAVGIAQKAGAIDLAAWHPDRPPDSPLGPFDHHANAASFLNLTLPVTAALACFAWRAHREALCAALAAAWAITAIGAVATGSKAGIALTLLTAALLALAVLGHHWRVTRSGLVPALALAVVAGGLILTWPTLADGLERARESAVSRTIAWRIGTDMARDAGWMGLGPGSFKLALPVSEHFDPQLYRHWIVTEHEPGTRVGPWSHLHQDYLQTVIEWGWLGAAMWLGLVGGALLGLARATWARAGDNQRTLALALLAALLVLGLHAAVDFPLQVPAIGLYALTCLGLAWGSACPASATP